MKIQELSKEINDWLIETMKDVFGSVTLHDHQSQHYHRSKCSDEESGKDYLLEIRTELFFDKDDSYVAITVFIDSDDYDFRCDFSVRSFKEAVTICSGFIQMSIVFHR